MEIKKIVLTGGPCAGKTTALNKIKDYLESKKINYLIVPETATEFDLNGLKFVKEERLIREFQKLILESQITKEKIAENYAKIFFKDKELCVIIYDRGTIDNKAYLKNQYEFDNILYEKNLSELEILDKYDLVLNLISLAVCKKELYKTNETRKESPEEAIILDKKTSNAWIGHRNLKIINSNISLEKEIDIIINYIEETIKDNTKKEIKEIILDKEKSNTLIYNENNSFTLNITNYFLNMDYNDNYNYVISKREYKNDVSYILTIYINTNSIKHIIKDQIITIEQFNELINKFNILNIDKYKEINFIDNLQPYKLKIKEDELILEIEENKLNKELLIPNNLAIKNKEIENTILNNTKENIKSLKKII